MRSGLRPAIVLLSLSLLAAAAPAAAAHPVADPPPAAERAVPAVRGSSGPFRLNLARANDFVAQTTFVRCVGASVQMMLNIERPGADRTTRTQARLQKLARSLSGPAPAGFVRHGASIRGWTAALTKEGDRPYRMLGADSLDEAMQLAARAIRTWNRPVGLLVWRGRHAWVMSGFVATADPALTDDFRVTRAYILDPLYPHGSTVWGPSPRPGTAISVSEVGRQFVRRRTSSRWNALPMMAELAGRYALVVPVAPEPPMAWLERATRATMRL
jgi:hypothetical protein